LISKALTYVCASFVLFVLYTLFTVPAGKAAAPIVSIVPLRVMSWNIQFGEGTDAITNYDRTASWIAAGNPDLVGLCEVPADSVPVLVNLLTQKTGRAWFAHFVPKYSGTDEGNLILSWRSFAGVNSRLLSANRSVAQVTINVGGKTINFFATHLDDQSSSNRVTEVAELKAFASGFSEPRMIVGDFNGGPDTAETIAMSDSYGDAWAESMNLGTALAYPDNPVGTQTRTRRGRIDYVFHSSQSSALSVKGAKIPDSRDLNNTNVVITLGTLDDKGVRPSDHNFVLADFDLNVDNPTPTPTPTPSPTATPTPAPSPTPTSPPVLLVDPSTNRALALHSTLFTRDPFSLTSPLNLGTDKRTRIALFCTNLDLLSGESISVVTARAVSSFGVIYDLPVEYVGKVPGYSWLTDVIVRLPEDPTLQGNLSVSIALRGLGSNSGTVALSP
jgi:endonuclease/exonuclease/phosphatase family metal-dependent hydrolase